METGKEKTEKIIKDAEKGAGTPIENITESIDNSPIWPDEEEARKASEKGSLTDVINSEKKDPDK